MKEYSVLPVVEYVGLPWFLSTLSAYFNTEVASGLFSILIVFFSWCIRHRCIVGCSVLTCCFILVNVSVLVLRTSATVCVVVCRVCVWLYHMVCFCGGFAPKFLWYTYMLTFKYRRLLEFARGDNARITLIYFVFSLITQSENCVYVR